VAGLGGAPGVLSARWAGPGKDFAPAMARIEQELAERGEADRRAFFTCALALAWPTSSGWSVDASPAALAQASVNLERAGVGDRVRLLEGSWWQPLRPLWGHLQLVVSNPPYIPTAVWAALDPGVREHEPPLALDGGADGLGALRPLAQGARAALAPGGLLLLEHHHDQSAAVIELLTLAGLEQVRAHLDLEGQQRFVSARRCWLDV
jgi:release factor glutamine methyltransferase